MEIVLSDASRADIFSDLYSQLALPHGGLSLDAAWDALSSLPEKCTVRLTQSCAAAECDAWRGRLLRLLRDAEREGFIELIEE